MNNTFTMRCVWVNEGNKKVYTVGKIYIVDNGKFVMDSGNIMDYKLDNFKMWNEYSLAKWELVNIKPKSKIIPR